MMLPAVNKIPYLGNKGGSIEEATEKQNMKLLDIVIRQEESLQPEHMTAAETRERGRILRGKGHVKT